MLRALVSWCWLLPPLVLSACLPQENLDSYSAGQAVTGGAVGSLGGGPGAGGLGTGGLGTGGGVPLGGTAASGGSTAIGGTGTGGVTVTGGTGGDGGADCGFETAVELPLTSEDLTIPASTCLKAVPLQGTQMFVQVASGGHVDYSWKNVCGEKGQGRFQAFQPIAFPTCDTLIELEGLDDRQVTFRGWTQG